MDGRDQTQAELPAELRGFNWGAFGLTWIWGLAHRTYFAFLVVVPLLGWFIVPFVLGWKGNEWAWRNRSWRSAEEFRSTQRSWGRYALFAWLGCIASSAGLVLILGKTMQNSEAFQLALARLSAEPIVAEQIGQPFTTGSIGGKISLAGASGTAEIDFPVTGPKGSGHAYVVAAEHAGQWSIDRMDLALPSGQRVPIGASPSTSVAALTAAPQREAQPQLAAAAPARAVRLAGGTTEVHGKLRRNQIDEVLARGRPGLQACFGSTPPAAGTEFAIKLIIAPDGRVQTAALQDPGSQFDRTVSPCVSREARAWSFPAVPQGGMCVVTHTIRVEPS